MAVSTETDQVGIRDAARLTGLSIDTLRWYERVGLLPLVTRGPGGRRRYSTAAIRFARLVRALRRSGMPVDDVRDFVRMGVGVQWHGRRMALLERQEAVIRGRLAESLEDLSVVREKIAHYRDLRLRGLDCEDEILQEDGAPTAPALTVACGCAVPSGRCRTGAGGAAATAPPGTSLGGKGTAASGDGECAAASGRTAASEDGECAAASGRTAADGAAAPAGGTAAGTAASHRAAGERIMEDGSDHA